MGKNNRAVTRILDYLLETRGRRLISTAKVLCNKLAYVTVRAFLPSRDANWIQSRWYWLHFPFSLCGDVLWTRSLSAWFWAADVVYLDNMLHLHRNEPVDWFAPTTGDTVLDVGAFAGWYSIRAARAVGSNGRVISLEPDEENRQSLEKNLALNAIRNCTVVPLAAWSEPRLVGFINARPRVWNHATETDCGARVLATTLDGLVGSLKLERVCWIKMDIEGAEVEALKGATKTLQKFSPTLFIEVHGTLGLLRGLLERLGYRIEQSVFDEPPDRHGWVLARGPADDEGHRGNSINGARGA